MFLHAYLNGDDIRDEFEKIESAKVRWETLQGR